MDKTKFNQVMSEVMSKFFKKLSVDVIEMEEVDGVWQKKAK